MNKGDKSGITKVSEKTHLHNKSLDFARVAIARANYQRV